MIPKALVGARPWVAGGAVLCGLAVALGAYGWHSLDADEGGQRIFMLGVQYHMWHGLALFAVAWLADGTGRSATLAAVAGVLFVVGIGLFAVNLYGLAVAGEVFLSGGAPYGGYAMMAGWAALAMAGLTRRRKDGLRPDG